MVTEKKGHTEKGWLYDVGKEMVKLRNFQLEERGAG